MAQSFVTNLLEDSRRLREQGRLLRKQVKREISALHKTRDAVHMGWTNILVFRDAETLFNSFLRRQSEEIITRSRVLLKYSKRIRSTLDFDPNTVFSQNADPFFTTTTSADLYQRPSS